MSENLFVMPSGEALPRCAYCQSRPILYRLKDTHFIGDTFDAYFCKDCDGIENAIQYLKGYGPNVDSLAEERMYYHSWAAEQTEEVLNRASNDRNIIYGAVYRSLSHSMIGEPEDIWWNSRQGDI